MRVCRAGGKVLIADVLLRAENIYAYDQLEKIRDSSHHHVLTTEDFYQLFTNAKLENISSAFYRMELELKQHLTASFPAAGDDRKIRQLFMVIVGDKIECN